MSADGFRDVRPCTVDPAAATLGRVPTGTARPPELVRPAAPGRTCLVASLLDDDGGADLVLSGHLDDEAIGRVAAHVDELLRRGVRDITVDARGVREAPAGLVDQLLRAQDRLTGRRGFVRVLGLRPDALRPVPPGRHRSS